MFFPYPYIEGISIQHYFPKDDEGNAQLYKETQTQRQLERDVRKSKRECAMLNELGDKEGFQKSALKLKQRQANLKGYCDDKGLKLKADRTAVDGYNKSVSTKVTQVTRNNSVTPKLPKETPKISTTKPLTIPKNSSTIENKTLFQFKTAENIKDADKFASDVLGIPKASYKGVDVETANAWNKGLANAFNNFPELKDNFGFVGECHERNALIKEAVYNEYLNNLVDKYPNKPLELLKDHAELETKKTMRQFSVKSNAMAQSWSPTQALLKPFRGITVNRDVGKNAASFIDTTKHCVDIKFHPAGCDTIQSVLDHEIGHQLDDMLQISDMDNIKKLFTGNTKQELTDKLSQYSWDNTNRNPIREMVAEAWAEYCNNPNSREIATEVGKTIERRYAEWAKMNL